MKHLATGLFLASASLAMAQGAMAEDKAASRAPSTSAPRQPVDHNSPELRVTSTPRGNIISRALVENFHRNTPTANRAYQAHLDVAGCVVDLSGPRAAQLLGGPGTSDPRYRRMNFAMQRQYNTCTSINYLAELAPSALNAALAEQLVRAGEQRPATRIAVAYTPAQPGTFQALAQCVVAQAPAQARAVLDTVVGSTEQVAALGRAYGAAAACSPGDLPTTTPQLVQRARIAESIYAADLPPG